ncbi:MAG TPA: hypothetical protein DEV73_04635 [Candidatus Zambryskibacteria bacterium]|uniref:DUF5666 domain-containing protein n=2 Tax=Candidatus Nomuraibacteriota TaxID=1752729 RepID=A0A1F6YUB7_9BACT|nr:MAG: hypothetical protein UR91_C0008G0005 [Candidatus Nomurabacteria bacterium GW2011_GWC2_35_8]OGJ05807.1 MAG: hypothetical protein A2238_01875 [Candidatus Nomurabacteria bacterium RIFOXYA2_FULL_35_9]OGJ09962.1 MAG: hypothetical protein A2456_01725 [Candidatus Nomurabacteria bacterium RIFOXYC2_FULL_36_19]OGJ15208.1 MAG: hypothetical protein A2554_03245 [Candidatus Nomurabacteria bacterium RIFOXYD2_FULL_35_12]HCH59866.1 hypothetical protein [Candidatus Zambryskibacteria bacterium]
MKTVSIIIAVAVLALTQGCAFNGNTAIAQKTGPLPYIEGEKATVTKTTTDIGPDGRVTTHTESEVKSGLAVNEGIQRHKLQVAEKVGTVQVQANSRPTWNAGYAWQKQYGGRYYPPSHPPQYCGGNGGGGFVGNGGFVVSGGSGFRRRY